ncbi:MAG: AEC family transporter [Candidatus Thorarchaeota archaeon]|nr:AEC family transporter [Candidatus Thorarchaeota archaeon]
MEMSELVIRIGLFYGFILLGYLFGRFSMRGQAANSLLTKLLVDILMPLLVLYALLTASSTFLEEIPSVLALALIIHLSGPLIFLILIRNTNIPPKRKGVFLLCSTFNNALFIPLPFVLMFIGSAGIPIVVTFSLTQMLLMVTFGSMIGSTYGDTSTPWKSRVTKALTFPPLLAALLAGFLLLLDFSLPELAVSWLAYTGDITTYLALVSVGLSVGTRYSSVNLRDALSVVLVRQAIVPLVMVPFIFLFALSPATTQVVILEALMPAAVLNVAYAGAFDLEIETAATIVTIGTILLLPVIPFILFFLG